MSINTRIRQIFRIGGSTFAALVMLSCGGDGGSSAPSVNLPTTQELGGILFTTIPLQESHYVSIIPLGNLNPSGHVFPTDHHYFVLTDGDATMVPVSAPGHVWISRVTQQEHLTDGFIDYKITMKCSQEVEAQFMHMSSIEQSILDQVGEIPLGETYTTGGKEYRNSNKNVWIEIQSGTLVGTAGGNPGQGALDFGVYDTLSTNSFANEARIEEMYKLDQATSCLDFFSADKRSILEAKCGNWDGSVVRTVAPIGGTVAQDILGTAQGMWFLPGAPNSPEDSHIALVHDNVDPTSPVFSIGLSIPDLPSATYYFTPIGSGEIDRDFSEITADGKVYAFEVPGHVILLELVNATTLRIERLASLPGSFNLSPDAVEFVR